MLVTQRLSADSLYRELLADPGAADGIEALGDCAATRLIADVIFDGHRLGREIDSEDPTLPLPYRRRRATLRTLMRPGDPARPRLALPLRLDLRQQFLRRTPATWWETVPAAQALDQPAHIRKHCCSHGPLSASAWR